MNKQTSTIRSAFKTSAGFPVSHRPWGSEHKVSHQSHNGCRFFLCVWAIVYEAGHRCRPYSGTGRRCPPLLWCWPVDQPAEWVCVGNALYGEEIRGEISTPHKPVRVFQGNSSNVIQREKFNWSSAILTECHCPTSRNAYRQDKRIQIFGYWTAGKQDCFVNSLLKMPSSCHCHLICVCMLAKVHEMSVWDENQFH